MFKIIMIVFLLLGVFVIPIKYDSGLVLITAGLFAIASAIENTRR